MQTLSIPYSEDLLIATGSTPKQLEQELRLLLAVKLFEIGRLSLGKAAEIAGLPKPRFMDDLGRLGVPLLVDDSRARRVAQRSALGSTALLGC